MELGHDALKEPLVHGLQGRCRIACQLNRATEARELASLLVDSDVNALLSFGILVALFWPCDHSTRSI